MIATCYIIVWLLFGILEIDSHARWWNHQLPAPFDRETNFWPWYRDNWQAYLFGPIAFYVGERQRNHMRR